MLTHTHGSIAPSKQSSAQSKHGATIRPNREECARKAKRNNPFGIIPARIARVELGIEALAAIDEDQRVLDKCEKKLAVLERQEQHVCIAYGIHHSMTARAYADARLRIKEAQRGVRVVMQERARKLREAVRPEILNLCSQADRAA